MDQEQSIAVALLRNFEELHSIPEVANRLLELTRFDDYDIREVATCLAQDPALAVKILRIANSAQFALHRPVTSVQQAAGLLGRRSLRLAALAFGLIGSLGDGLAKQVVDRYWRRAITMAIAAKQLASLAGGPHPHDCYTAALLADVGVLALAQTFGDEYVAMHKKRSHDERLIVEERSRFGCGHPAVSARLLAQWELPGDLAEAAARHHRSIGSGVGMPAVVQHANLLADVLLVSLPADRMLAVRQRFQQSYSLRLDEFIDFCRAVQTELEAEWRAYDLTPVRIVDTGKLLAAARSQYQSAAFDAALDLDSLAEPFELQGF